MKRKAWFSHAVDAPATWQPVLPRILFRYENRSGRQHCSSPACLWSWLKFNFTGIQPVKLYDVSSCRRRMFSFVREVAQTSVPAATSQINRRHMRTMLSRIYCKVKYIRHLLFFFKLCISLGLFYIFLQYSFLIYGFAINFHLWLYTVISYRIMFLIKSLFHNLQSHLMGNSYLLKPRFKGAVPKHSMKVAMK